MDPFISIIVPSRGRLAQLGTLLRCLSRQEPGPRDGFEVIVGLDGHDAAEAAGLPCDWPFRVTYLPLPAVGISAAKNAAIAAARGEVLLLVNDDIEPAPGFVAAHAAAQRAGQPVVLGASPFVRWDDQTVFDELVARSRMIFFYAELADGGAYNFRYAWNLNVSVHRRLVEQLDGPFCDGLRPVFFDDVEFAHRLIGGAPRVRYCAAALAPHRHRYDFRGYFEREALLGVMATALHEVNPACFAAIFRASPAALIAAAREGLERDVPDGRKMLSAFSAATHEPWTGGEPSAYCATLYAMHLPLKRRAFRCGLTAAADCPDAPWQRRMAMAVGALRADPVFSTHVYWTDAAAGKPAGPASLAETTSLAATR